MIPREYCAEHHISSTEFINRVREVAPKYHKSTNAMVNNPDYGVTLRQFVVRHMKGKQENRTNPCRIQFRVTQAQKERLTQLKELLDVPTIQDVMICVLKVFFAQLDKERAAALSGTEDSGNEKDVT